MAETDERERGGYLADCLGPEDIVTIHRHPAGFEHEGYFSWATVRNPFDRFISVYHGACERLGDRTFDEFVDEVTTGNIYAQDFIRWPQSWWITWKNEVVVDELVDFDEMVPRTFKILRGLGVPTDRDFPHLKASERKPWQEYYTDEQVAQIANVYADDIQLYRGVQDA
jgi:hypothetical protein